MTPQWLTDLKENVSQLEAETTKFYEKGNKSAGTRTRKLLQDIKSICQAGRTTFKNLRLLKRKLNSIRTKSSHLRAGFITRPYFFKTRLIFLVQLYKLKSF